MFRRTLSRQLTPVVEEILLLILPLFTALTIFVVFSVVHAYEPPLIPKLVGLMDTTSRLKTIHICIPTEYKVNSFLNRSLIDAQRLANSYGCGNDIDLYHQRQRHGDIPVAKLLHDRSRRAPASRKRHLPTKVPSTRHYGTVLLPRRRGHRDGPSKFSRFHITTGCCIKLPRGRLTNK